MNDSIRLSKYLSQQIACSRREAENYIEGGWVSVDGSVIEEPGFRIHAQQKVELADGASAADHEPVTILFHKPAGYRVERADDLLRGLITGASQAVLAMSSRRFVKKDVKALQLLTRLELNASGLMVVTQEPRIARKLTEDASKMEHEYVVEVEGEPLPNGLARLNHGLAWKGVPLAPAKVSWQSETRLRFALKNPQIGQIAAMCDQVGLQITAMKRIRVGGVPMSSLPAGQWRYLLDHERF